MSNPVDFEKLKIELKSLTIRLSVFDRKKLIAKGFPLWIINSEEEYLKNTIKYITKILHPVENKITSYKKPKNKFKKKNYNSDK